MHKESVMENGLTIKKTTEEDLENIRDLWNNGTVMYYVGFPEGLGVELETLKEKWLPAMNKNTSKSHYSIYHEDLGFCGESYYEVDEKGLAALDIKLMPKTQGRGIAYAGLKHAISEAFLTGKADFVYVDPHKENAKALKLYERVGFVKKEHPDPEERDRHYYMELSKSNFMKNT